MRRPVSGLLAALFWLAGASIASAGQATGTFQVGSRRIAPRHAAAYLERDPRDPRQTVVEVVLSERPVDAAEAAAALAPHTALVNQESLREGGYILLWVRRGGEVSMNATFARTMTQYVDGTRGLLRGLVAELRDDGPERVSGRVRTRVPVETRGGDVYSLDVAFSTAVTRPPPGEPLGAGGGDAGRALIALAAAIEREDWPAVRAALAAERRASLEADYRSDAENLAYALDVLSFWLPKKNARVVGGERRGESAVLEVEGDSPAGHAALHAVRMVREDGAWRFADGVLVGLLPAPKPPPAPRKGVRDGPEKP